MVPTYGAAIGKALLAFRHKKEWEKAGPLQRFTQNTLASRSALYKELERIRRIGYAVDNEEVVPGCRCVGVPIPNGRAEPLAAISISGPATLVTPMRELEFATMIREACIQIASQLGHLPTTHPALAG